MLIKEESFRKLYKSPILVKNEEFAYEIARTLKIDSIMDDNLSSKELGEMLNTIEIEEDINSVLLIPYIDHEAGMSFYILTTALINGNDVKIYKRESFDVMGNCRKDKINDFEFEYLDNLNVNDDFNLNYYDNCFEIVKNYYINESVESLRFVELLDEFRHENYPDDVQVLFYKNGLENEGMWVRYENIIEVPIIEGKLLNKPYQDFGVDVGDIVEFYPYRLENDEIILLCNLEK